MPHHNASLYTWDASSLDKMNISSDQNVQNLDAGQLIDSHSRRQFLGIILKSIAAGACTGYAADLGMGYISGRAADFAGSAEKDIRALALDLKAASGTLEHELRKEADRLRTGYAQAAVISPATPGKPGPFDKHELETILQNLEDFQEHYDLGERVAILKDRIDRKLLDADLRIESRMPRAINSLNDSIRRLFGMPVAGRGRGLREALSAKLEDLCRIYETNEDNLVAENQVLKKINDYLSSTALPDEQRKIFRFLRQEYNKSGDKGFLRDFIMHYKDNIKDAGQREALLRFRHTLERIDDINGIIRKDKSELLLLQDYLKKGIALKQAGRARAPYEFMRHEKEMRAAIDELKSNVEGTVRKLEQRGYNIETRDHFVNNGKLAEKVGLYFGPVRAYTTLLMGAAGTFLSGYHMLIKRRHMNMAEASRKSAEKAVELHNELAERCNDPLQGRYSR